MKDLKVNIIDHPLIRHKLTIMRQKDTGSKDFRQLLDEISMLMTYEISRDFPCETIEIETPVAHCRADILAGKKVAVVPILRAGLGMVNGIVNLIPNARIGHIGLYRDEKTLEPVEYFCKMPKDIDERLLILLDPMLATGGSAIEAVNMLKKRGAKSIIFLCLLAAPEGIRAFNKVHPEIPIYTACVDERLNEHGYIVPGIGDAGDRIFGTL